MVSCGGLGSNCNCVIVMSDDTIKARPNTKEFRDGYDRVFNPKINPTVSEFPFIYYHCKPPVNKKEKK